MYPNLLGMKAYHHMSNEDMAKVINISRQSYEHKIKTGKFTVSECKAFCNYFEKEFSFLFSEPNYPRDLR